MSIQPIATRADFLLKMYEMAWENITRTDDLLWKVFTSYTALIVGAVFLSDKLIQNPFLGLLISLIITSVAICYSFNVNSWFLRNLVLITNLEASFLKSSDYGTIIPQRWHPPYTGKFINLEFPSILGFVYPLFPLLMTYYFWEKVTYEEKRCLIILSFILFIIVCLYVAHLISRFEALKEEARGPITETSKT